MAARDQRHPVFIYGALRSGTTVFRLMLISHEQIASPGEADFLLDHIAPDDTHPSGWRYAKPALAIDRIFRSKGIDIPDDLDGRDLFLHFLDRLARPTATVTTLSIHRHLDRLLDLLPEARVIHMLRDPRDVARSSIGMGWAGTLYHGVDHWMQTETAWDRSAGRLQPGRTMTLRYEDLFRDTEAALREVTAFLGLPYSPDMLRYHETSSYARPDPSLVEQWRRTSSPAEIALLEGKAGALMAARGYAPTGPGSMPGPVQRLILWLRNKSHIFRFAVRRYGLFLVLGEKITRRFGATGAHRRMRLRIQEKSVAHLK
jgi:hypothetical protein